jgi:protein-S-isoprenylcysteine O-methyltransferase Ste14
MNFLTGFVALAYFVMIAAATRQHFTAEKYPMGMHLISFLSLIGVSVFMAHAFLWTLNAPATVLTLFITAFALFLWAAKHSKDTQLGLAFASDVKSDNIITSRPWQYFRHPFCVSYILFWLACAWGTLHLASVIVCTVLLFIYIYSALREEAALKVGQHADTYIAYSKKTGLFFPKRAARH